MQKIQIGRAPDYSLMRGLEIINYRCKLSGTVQGEVFRSRMVSDRSLLMLVKKLRQHIPHNFRGIDIEIGSDVVPNTVFDINYPNQAGRFRVTILLPSDLTEVQLSELIEVFRKYLRMHL